MTARMISDFLARFFRSDDLAAECRARGLRGRPQSQTHCILAELIRAQFPGIAVGVCPSAKHGKGLVYIGPDQIALPSAANAFGHGFDYGRWPELERGYVRGEAA